MKASRTVAILALAAACAEPGCSFLLVDGPPSADRVREFHPLEECTDSFRAPTADIIVAGIIPPYLLLKGMTSGLAEDKTEATVVGVSGLVLASVLAVSAVWGFYTVHKCRQYLVDPPRHIRRPMESRPR